jgi:hypothetical protein
MEACTLPEAPANKPVLNDDHRHIPSALALSELTETFPVRRSGYTL